MFESTTIPITLVDPNNNTKVPIGSLLVATTCF